MAAKKDKPALFELIDKGNLTTPGWFYNNQKSMQKMHTGATVTAPPADGTISGEANGEESRPIRYLERAPAHGGERAWIRLDGHQLQVSVSCWILGPALALVLALTFLLAYRIGRSNSTTTTTVVQAPARAEHSYQDAPPSEKLNKIVQGTVQHGVLPAKDSLTAPPAGTAAPSGASAGSTASSSASKNTAASNLAGPARQPATGAARQGQCLVLCGSSSKAPLETVAAYFNAKNLPVTVARDKYRYVLASVQTFETTSSSQARAFKNRLKSLGNSYEKEKPRNAPSFASAFKSMYWVNVKNLSW